MSVGVEAPSGERYASYFLVVLENVLYVLVGVLDRRSWKNTSSHTPTRFSISQNQSLRCPNNQGLLLLERVRAHTK